MSSNRHDKFEQDLRKCLNGYEEMPPAGLWEDIAGAIAQDEKVAEKKRRRPIVAWLSAMGVAASIALCVIALNNDDSTPGAPAPVIAETVDKPQPAQPSEAETQEPATEVSASTPAEKSLLATAEPAVQAESPATPSITEPGTASTQPSITEPAPSSTETIAKREEQPTEKSPSLMEQIGTSQSLNNHVAQVTTASSGRWSASVYGSGFASGKNAVDFSSPVIVPSGMFAAPMLIGEQRKKILHNKIPITVGAMVRYKISDRWSLDAGVTFTHQESTITTSLGDAFNTYIQTLRYVGIPVGASYTVYRNRWVDAYATAHLSIDKCIQARTTRIYGTIEHPWVYGASIAPGVQTNITPNLSIYLEPGVTYHMIKKGDMPTRYDDRPVEFDLRMGLRWTFDN